jgi:hypothetical protein
MDLLVVVVVVVVEGMNNNENEEDNMHGATRNTGRPSRLQLLFSKRARKKHKIRRFLIYLPVLFTLYYLGE